MGDQAIWSRRGLFGYGAGSLLALSGAVSVLQAAPVTPETDPIDAPPADPWREFAAITATLGTLATAPGVPAHDIDRAEGDRLLSRYISCGLDFCLEYADPAYPAFFNGTRDGTRKYAGDNPDELYDHAAVSADHAYRIRGSMRGTELLECGIYSGDNFTDPTAKPVRLLRFITEQDLTIARDGSFELRVGGAPGKGQPNHISLEPGSSSLLVRRYRRSPFIDCPAMMIERIDNPGNPPVLTQAAVAARLALAAHWAQSNARLWAGYVDRTRATKRNMLVGFEDNGGLGAPGGHKYLEGYWDVPSDKALLIEFTPPDAPYWNLLICNYWMESLEWRFGNGVNFNNHQVRPDADGLVRFVISHRRPRRADVNWLEAQGHYEGQLVLRAARVKGAMPKALTRLVSADEI